MGLLMAVVASAQSYTVTGKVTEADGTTPVELANVQLLSLPDSSMQSGVLTKERTGAFSLTARRPGRYALKVSYIGYTPHVEPVSITAGKTNYNLGVVKLADDGFMLKDMVVTGRASKVEMKADTMVYNSSAYRIPEGSTLEELVRQLPGAEVDDNGKITINGKEVKKILLNGKEFFGSDINTAMKNLPVNIVEKIKSYDKKSDLAKATGIDDGEDETVIDLGVKKENMNSWFGNVDASYGTKDRYSERFMFSQFNDKQKFMLLGSLNNVGDRNFPGGGGGFRGGQNNGENTSRMLMGNYSLQTNKVDADFNAAFSHSDANILSKGNSQNFTTNQYGYSNSKQRNHNLNFNLWGRVEWTPDSLTKVFVRPTVSYGKTRSDSKSYSTTSNDDWGSEVDDPYGLMVENAEKNEFWKNKENIDLVNFTKRNSASNGNSFSAGLDGMYNRRLSSNGRNFTVRAQYQYSKNNSYSYSYNNTLYADDIDTKEGQENLIRRYTTTPVKSYTYGGGAMWSEPLTFVKGLFFILNYRFTYRYNQSDRSMYDMNTLNADGNLLAGNDLAWNMNGFTFPSNWSSNQTDYLDKDQSTYATYKYFNHNARVQLRFVSKKINVNVGASFQPQRTVLSYMKGTFATDTTRNVFNVSPTLDFRYKINNTSQLRIRYRGTSNQASMTDLLNVVDNSDPMNISAGNPGLRPSFTNSLNVFFNTYNPQLQQGFFSMFDYSNTLNAFSTRRITDKKTGNSVSRPENISGNWSARGVFVFNTAIGSAKKFNISSFTNGSFENAVAYTSTVKDGSSINGNISSMEDVNKLFNNSVDNQKSTTKNTRIREKLTLSYRTDYWELGVNGSLEYYHSTNDMQKQGNMNTWTYAYGPRLTLNLPWGTSLSTDASYNARRGYSSASMNTNEWLWNLQVSQSFLRKKNLILSVQFYDLLHQQSNVSRAVTAFQRSDTWYNAVNSYMMVHVIYRFNSAKGNKGPQDRGPGGRGGFGRPMGPPPGGFGGPRF